MEVIFLAFFPFRTFSFGFFFRLKMEPTVFQCTACKTILGDSVGYSSYDSDLEGLLLSGFQTI